MSTHHSSSPLFVLHFLFPCPLPPQSFCCFWNCNSCFGEYTLTGIMWYKIVRFIDFDAWARNEDDWHSLRDRYSCPRRIRFSGLSSPASYAKSLMSTVRDHCRLLLVRRINVSCGRTLSRGITILLIPLARRRRCHLFTYRVGRIAHYWRWLDLCERSCVENDPRRDGRLNS